MIRRAATTSVAIAFYTDVLGHSFWCLKDLSWCVHFYYIGLVAAAASVAFEISSQALVWSKHSWILRLRDLACLTWLCGNTVWLAGEALWEPAGGGWSHHHYPWAPHGPLMRPSIVASANAVFLARSLFFVGLFFTIAGVLLLVVTARRSSHAASLGDGEDQVLTPLHTFGFVGFWICKDLCWLAEELWAGLTFGLVVLLLLAAPVVVFDTDTLSWSRVIWVAGNVVWMWEELGHGDQADVFRTASGVLLLVACALGFCCLRSSPSAEEELEERVKLMPLK